MGVLAMMEGAMRIREIPANALTAARILTVPFLLYFYWERDGTSFLLTATFAGLTDLADGYVAKILDAKTAFGARFDIIADKCVIFTLLFVTCSEWVHSPWFWGPFAVFAMYHGFVIYGWLWLHMKERDSDLWAKRKTALEMIGLPISISSFCLGQTIVWSDTIGPVLVWLDGFGLAAMYVAAAIALGLGIRFKNEFLACFACRRENVPA